MGNFCSSISCSDEPKTRTIGTSTDLDYLKIKIKPKTLPTIPENNQI